MNQETDALNIVTREEGRGTFRIFQRKRTEQYGFTLIVFRKKMLLDYLPSTKISVESDITRKFKQIVIKEGDDILAINQGPKPLTLKGQLKTQEDWSRPYQIQLDIYVEDPIQFAQLYIQESDPVANASRAITGYMQKKAYALNHDDTREEMVMEWVQHALDNAPYSQAGIKVYSVNSVDLKKDLFREREIELERQRYQDELQIEKDAYINRVKDQQLHHLRVQQTMNDNELAREKEKEEQRSKESTTVFAIKIDDIQSQAEQVKAQQQKQLQHRLEQTDLEQKHLLDSTQNSFDQQQELYRLIKEEEIQRQRSYLKSVQIQQEQEIEHKRLLLEGNIQQLRMLQERASETHTNELTEQKWKSEQARKNIERFIDGTLPSMIDTTNDQIADNQLQPGSIINPTTLRPVLDFFEAGKQEGGQKLLNTNSSTADAVPSSNITEETTQPVQKTHKLPTLPGVIVLSEDSVEIPDIGIRLSLTQLSDEQCDCSARAHGENTGFIIYSIHEYSTAKQAQLKIGDIIVEINSLEIFSIQDLSQAVSTREIGKELSICAIRNIELQEFTIKNPDSSP